MPRIDRQGRSPQNYLMEETDEPLDTDLLMFWGSLGFDERKSLMTVDRKTFYEQLREHYCSRCHGLFAQRCDDLAVVKSPLGW
jgi:hypothetical protein